MLLRFFKNLVAFCSGYALFKLTDNYQADDKGARANLDADAIARQTIEEELRAKEPCFDLVEYFKINENKLFKFCKEDFLQNKEDMDRFI